MGLSQSRKKTVGTTLFGQPNRTYPRLSLLVREHIFFYRFKADLDLDIPRYNIFWYCLIPKSTGARDHIQSLSTFTSKFVVEKGGDWRSAFNKKE